MATGENENWGDPQTLRTGIGALVLVPLGMALLVGAAAALVEPVLGIATVLVLSGGFLVWMLTRGPGLLRRLNARALEQGEEPRLENLVSGIAADIRFPSPRLWVIPRSAPNALVVWSRGADHLALTEGLLREGTRTQLEAVVAHGLVRLSSGEARRATLALSWGPLGSSLVRVGAALDTRAAALTRYPPALADAIQACEPLDPMGGPLWFVGPGPAHAGREDRAAALLDL